MKRINFLLLGVAVCLSVQQAAASDITRGCSRRAAEPTECAIALIKAPSGYCGTHSGYLYESNAHGGYDGSGLSFFDCGPRGALAVEGMLARAGQDYFYLRLDAGKWCAGVPGSEYFWSYPLPSVAVADGVYLVAIPQSILFSSQGEEPRYSALKNSNPFFSSEHAASYQLLDGMARVCCDMAALYSYSAPDSLKSQALYFWRALAAFANWYGGAVATDFPPSFRYGLVRAFIKEIQKSVTPAHLPVTMGLGSAPLSAASEHAACVLGVVADCLNTGSTSGKLASPTGVSCRAEELGEVEAARLPPSAEQSGKKVHEVARNVLIRGKRPRA